MEFKLSDLKYFYMMIGLPASGKSTWIKNNVHNDTHVLSTDGLIEEYAKSQGKTYNEVFKERIGPATDLFFKEIEYCVERGLNVLIDRTNLNVKSRKKILDMVPKDYIKVAVVVTCDDAEEHLNRLISRPGKSIPGHIIKNMRESYQEPSKSEGFKSIVLVNTTSREVS
jgi:predicted kinase